ncbi:MAG TPA: OmpA family protein [Bacteroidales bacterium]|nr:OmpA family protein [Bacteroidales bacterium]
MRSSSVIFILLIFSFVTESLFSQGLHTSSEKALKSYNAGISAYDYLDLVEAESCFMKAVSIDKKFYEAYIMLGELMEKQKRFSEAASSYKSAVKIDSLFFRPVFFNLANAEMMSGDYSHALTHFKVYQAQTGMSPKNKAVAEENIRNCEFALVAMKKPVQFNPVSVGPGINTNDDEYWPSITADGHTLMFTRQVNVINNPGFRGIVQEDFYISYLVNNVWQKALNAEAPLNSMENEGAQTLSSDGNYMFFTGCNRAGGMGSCDIYFSAFKNGKWTQPSNVGPPINTNHWESQPSISADGKTLFFSSNRPGGFGGKDLWVSRLNENNRWGVPKNMGSNINTAGDEMSPFIHFDGKTLYFASDGRVGMGGFDLYMTRMKDDSTWTEPQNLGYPINTYNDEMGLIIESAGQKAYYSSTKDKSQGKDIFSFDLYASIRPDPVSYLKGKVYDKETGKLLQADYELVNLSTGKILMKNATDEMGNFLVCLPSGFNYGINVSKPGYLFYSENFTFEGIHTASEPFIKRIVLNPLKIGEKMLLSNVFYEIDSWQLKKESLIELNNLVSLLSDNKNLVMEIGGYTDSTGSEEYNMVLSEKRALSVVNYLIKMGISADRLQYKGYGTASSLGDNITVEGRKLNRRTEAKIINLKK